MQTIRSQSKKEEMNSSSSPNYLSVGIGYFEHSISPITERWLEWTNSQRILASLILLPIIFFPFLVTISFLLPWILIIGAAIYISLFGLETSRRHVEEAINQRFTSSATNYQSFDEIRKKALELKNKAGNYGTDGLYYLVDSFSVVAHYALSTLMFGLDHSIELLVSLSRRLNIQKKKIEKNRSQRASPHKKLSYKPIVLANDNEEN